MNFRFSEHEKKEIRQDALNKKRRRYLEIADKKAELYVQKHISNLTVDEVIKFLMDAQKIRGPFPISKSVPATTRNFKL